VREADAIRDGFGEVFPRSRRFWSHEQVPMVHHWSKKTRSRQAKVRSFAALCGGVDGTRKRAKERDPASCAEICDLDLPGTVANDANDTTNPAKPGRVDAGVDALSALDVARAIALATALEPFVEAAVRPLVRALVELLRGR
jgi:hypothetical protein